MKGLLTCRNQRRGLSGWVDGLRIAEQDNAPAWEWVLKPRLSGGSGVVWRKLSVDRSPQRKLLSRWIKWLQLDERGAQESSNHIVGFAGITGSMKYVNCSTRCDVDLMERHRRYGTDGGMQEATHIVKLCLERGAKNDLIHSLDRQHSQL